MSEKTRLPGFYKYSPSERIRLLLEREIISDADYHALMDGKHVLSTEEADRLIENVVGVFGLPMGLGLNFVINKKEYVVPLVVEEPSIVAALSSAAKVVRGAGGFEASADESLLIGQIQVVDVKHPVRARAALQQQHREIVDLANSLHPKMVARGGGARSVEVMIHPRPSSVSDMIVVHLLVDTSDAMGANLVNTMCEGVAPLIERISGGRVFLRILSNLTDRSMVHAQATLPPSVLAGNGFSGEEVRDGIILANDFAAVDPYRAATHNKGIMNGIDAVAIATGNDWRAIEAAAHAYAGRGSAYTSLTKWYRDPEGALVGSIAVPMKVGTVGGSMHSNPAVGFAHRVLGVDSAKELAQVMAVVGLAQNFAALRALSTEGIQRGHMTLHARSCAVSAGAPPEYFQQVVEDLIASGEVKVWKAKEILADLQAEPAVDPDAELGSEETAETYAAGHGKVILLGEHSVVHGTHAIAAPIPLAVQARVEAGAGGIQTVIPRWGVEETLRPDREPQNAVQRSLHLIVTELGVADRDLLIESFPHIPRANGLGASASVAVATIRAVARFCDLDIDDDEVNRIAFESEMLAHGNPSGIDNTIATFGRFIMFKKGDPPEMRELSVPRPIPIVIGLSGTAGLTAKTVAMVREGYEASPTLYERMFAEIDALTLEAADAVKAYDLPRLGHLMDVNHGLLNAMRLSTWELEELIGIARENGALGAKLTGGGGGGAMLALCPDGEPKVREQIAAAMRAQGYRAIITEIG